MLKGTILVAMDRNRGIGQNGQLLCHLPKDLKLFRKITLSQVVIMGRKTWESLPNRYLDQRHNIVITSQEDLGDSRLILAKDPIQAILRANSIIQSSQNPSQLIFVIGGEKVYRQMIAEDLVDQVVITHILEDFTCDTYFPTLDDKWYARHVSYDYDNGYKLKRLIYAKISICNKENM